MAKYRIEYNKIYTPSPLSFWVHIDVKNSNENVWIWEQASTYKPPLPKTVKLNCFPMLIVEALGYELKFSSIEEVEHFLEVVTQKNMPTSSKLARKRKLSTGLNSHWLSRLPAKLKSWRNREKYIPIIRDGLKLFESIYGSKH
jgi:hypothetical protein